MLQKITERLRRSRYRRLEKRHQKSICILIPYFGAWPEWTELFFESCRHNPLVDWLILSDNAQNAPACPSNVQIRNTSIGTFLDQASHALDINLRWTEAYKICDLRLAFGHIFDIEFRNYKYFGWGDIDVIYGDISSFLTADVLQHDVISFCESHLNGHFCLLRNTERAKYAYRELENWEERMSSPNYNHFDEIRPNELPKFLHVYCRESFNTPLSPLIPWTNGKFEFPSEWYWRNGLLTNDMDGSREFLYLHFMHWKGGKWPRECGNAQWEKLERLVHLEEGECRTGFRINELGFFPLKK